ncbi:MAG: MBL fold metallo-hydrolase [Candidatus Dormibacteria bacterium]
MEITFLGTGAAVSPHAYNVAMLIDRTLLVDAGAPLSVHLPRAGASVADPRAVILSHFHGDHTFGLAWLILARVLSREPAPPLRIIGPLGTGYHVTRLMELAWGPEILETARQSRQLEVQEVHGGEDFEVEGFRARAYPMTHTTSFSCLGYVLERDGIRLGYSGDAEMSAELETLLGASNHAVVEMTYDSPGPMHLSRSQVEDLMGRHPSVSFILTHLSRDASLPGALTARDFQTIRLPLR